MSQGMFSKWSCRRQPRLTLWGRPSASTCFLISLICFTEYSFCANYCNTLFGSYLHFKHCALSYRAWLILACLLLKILGIQKMNSFVWQSFELSVIVCVAPYLTEKGLFGISHLWPGPMQAKAVNLVRRGTEQP